jgi:opacity protein-like surface antigen
MINKKKIIALLFIFSGCLQLMNAQSWDEGKIVISAGYGFPNFGKLIVKSFQSEANFTPTGVGPIHGKFEYGLTKKIGVGLSINYSAFGAKWTDTQDKTDAFGNPYTVTYDYKVSSSAVAFNPRLNIHFATTEKVDAYWGIGIGYKVNKVTFSSTDPDFDDNSISGSLIPVGFETTFGLRYYFTENIGLYTELGLSRSLIQGGLSIKL